MFVYVWVWLFIHIWMLYPYIPLSSNSLITPFFSCPPSSTILFFLSLTCQISVLHLNSPTFFSLSPLLAFPHPSLFPCRCLKQQRTWWVTVSSTLVATLCWLGFPPPKTLSRTRNPASSYSCAKPLQPSPLTQTHIHPCTHTHSHIHIQYLN